MSGNDLAHGEVRAFGDRYRIEAPDPLIIELEDTERELLAAERRFAVAEIEHLRAGNDRVAAQARHRRAVIAIVDRAAGKRTS